MLAALATACAVALFPSIGSGARQSAQGCTAGPTQVDTAGVDDLFGDDDPNTPKKGNEIPHADTISGLGGNDRIQSYKCADVLSGDEGADQIFAGSGNDVVHAGARSDLVFGADGNDKLYGDPDTNPGGCKGDECEADQLSGGDGNDLLVAKFGLDRLNGGKGKDKCVGGSKAKFKDCETVVRKAGGGGKKGGAKKSCHKKSKKHKKKCNLEAGGGDDTPPAVPTTTVINIAVNDNKDLVHTWGTTTPHVGSDLVYVVVQHKGASGDWGAVKAACLGFGSDGRYQHDFALTPDVNYRAQARYGQDLGCGPVAYAPSSADSGLFNVK